MTPVDQPDAAEPADHTVADADGARETDGSAATKAADEADAGAGTEPEWVRRRRLDAVFGDGAHGQSLGDRWYHDQVPPHHG